MKDSEIQRIVENMRRNEAKKPLKQPISGSKKPKKLGDSGLLKIIKILENIETNTRRLLLLAEADEDLHAEDLGGPGEELQGALERLDTAPSIIPCDEDRGDEERRRPSNLE